MEYLPYLYITFFLLLSAFFSGSETALFALNPLQVQKIKEQKVWVGSIISKLLKRPKTLLITIITGNLFINIGLSNYFGFFLEDVYQRKLPSEEKDLLILIILTPLLIIFGEIFPKIISVQFNQSIAVKVAPLLYFIAKLLFPLRFFISLLIDFLLGSLNLDKSENSSISKKEISAAVDSATDNGFVSEPEGKRVLSVLETAEIKVADAMIPIEDMLLVVSSCSLASAKKQFILSKKNWAFLYTKDESKISGVVKLSFAVPYFFKVQTRKQIGQLVQKIPSILETLTLNKALDLFLNSRTEVALVVDEYGVTIGSITLKELQNRLFQNKEETQKNILKQIQLVSNDKHVLKVQGSLLLNDFNKMFGLNLKSDYVESIAGFIIEKLKGFPRYESQVVLFTDFKLSKFIIKDYTLTHFNMTISEEKLNYYLQKRENEGSK